VLWRVEREGAYAADLLHARLARDLKREDAALATELTLGVLRWQRLLDFLLERHLTKLATHLDTEVLLALRLGLYQLRFLTRIPARAAVHESVELVKSARKHSAAGLVNAVLRRAASAADETPEKVDGLLPPNLSLAERLAIRYSHPTWMVERWLEALGQERTVALLGANNRPRRLACALHDAAHREQALAALKKARLSVEPGRLLRSALTVSGGNPAVTPAFRRGWISIQDEASQLVALLLGVEPGHSVLDLCAAPGGKTALLARAAGRDARVVAADLHAHRLRAMNEQLRRVGVANVQLLAIDATAELPFSSRFDRILLDAPCSGTGTLSGNPEIRWRLRPEDLADFHRRQVRLLSNALQKLAPGGRLVYSTCSLEPEECEQQIEALLARNSALARVPVAPAEIGGIDSFVSARGDLRTFPFHLANQNERLSGCDGFFAARLRRLS
jgi:16S rRNA (cytosine967-C5)-methyltransferase